ncbi:MAG: C10 family peptidase [Kiritimatiellae bacterium]|nr:C10 family peptidase [Kiritimatiellia bacterium]
MKSKAILVALLALAFHAQAAHVTQSEAAGAASAWAGAGEALGVRLGGTVESVREYAVTNGYSFYAVRLGGGTVITSSDTALDPIVAFSPSGDLDLSESGPLLDMLRKDIAVRAALADASAAPSAAKGPSASVSASDPSAASPASSLWATLLGRASAAAAPSSRKSSRTSSEKPLSSISDVRVAPLVKSKWSQGSVSGGYCYNYYTPGHYVCGCTATAMSQIMRYFEFPKTPVGAGSYKCEVDGSTQTLTMQGGTYDWANMTLVPAKASLSDANRQAIGRLTSDTGIALKSSYADGNTTAYVTDVPAALRDTFGYADAICYWNDSNWSTGKGGLHTRSLRERVIYANLDARQPVQFAIYGYKAGHVGDEAYWAGHAVVADGYGFMTVGGVEVEYVHINMGWAGTDDMWYNIPEINAANSGAHVGDSGYDFKFLGGAVFNISTNDTGLSILSGRVTDEDGVAVAGADVSAFDEGGACVGETKTDEYGVYCFKLPGSASYSVMATSSDGRSVAELDARNLPATTGLSGSYVVADSVKVGNSWGNDMTLICAAVRVGTDVFASLDRAIARAREVAAVDPSFPVLVEILDATRLKGSQVLDFDCVITATNSTPAASPVERIGGAQLKVSGGASLVLSNIVFSAGSDTVVDVAENGSLGVSGIVDFGVPVDVAAVRTAAADGLRVLGEIGVGFVLDCTAAMTADSQFGIAVAATDEALNAISESVPRIVNIYDPFGEMRGSVQGAAPDYSLVWFEQPVPIEDAVGFYVDADGNTNTAARIDRLFERYSNALAAGSLGDDHKMVLLKDGSLSRSLSVPDGLVLSGDNVVIDLADAPATVFSVGGGGLSVTGVTFTNFVGNALFLVNGETASLQLGTRTKLVDIEGTNYHSGAVAVLNGSARISGGAVLDNCRATGRYKVSRTVNSYGGGVYVEEGASLVLAGCTITNCWANNYGGGVFAGGRYANKKSTVSFSGELRIAGNASRNSSNYVGDNVYLKNPSAERRVTANLTAAVTGSVGVRWAGSGSDTSFGNNDGLMLVKAKSAVVAHESVGAFFCDVNASLAAEAVDDSPDGPGLAWTAAPKGPQPLPADRIDEASARVDYDADGVTEYYLLVSDALKALKGDATVSVVGWNGITLTSDITISNAVTLRSDTDFGFYWMDRDADCSLIVGSGGSLSLKDIVFYGSKVTDETTKETDGTSHTRPLFAVDGGTLKMLTPSDRSQYATKITAVLGDGKRDAGAVSVWNGGEFIMASGAEITDCVNAYANEADGAGRGGAVLVDGATATFAGGTVTGCSAYTGGGVFIGNNGNVKVSGDTVITGNFDLDGKPSNLVVYDHGRLRLTGKLTGSIGYTEGVAGDTEIFGKANSSVSLADALSSAHNFTHDRTGDIGLAVSGDAGTLLVWGAALASDGTYEDEEGNEYELVPGDEYAVYVPVAMLGLVYNGNAQTGVCEGVGFTLSDNVKTNAGSYVAKAAPRPGFKWSDGSTAQKSISWSIDKATYDMSGVTFSDETCAYDGKPHSLEVSGSLPSGVTVSYENNGHQEVGVYEVTAIFSGDAVNYYSIPDMKATLTIVSVNPDPSQPMPIAFTAVAVADGTWTISFTTAVERCWYTLFETNSLTGGFDIGNAVFAERRQAVAGDVPTMTFIRPSNGSQLFWKVVAEPADAHTEAP